MTVYKISRASLQIVDSISEESSLATWISFNALMTNDDSFVGYAKDERMIHKFYVGTCAAKSYYYAGTHACAACDAGSLPSLPFSAESCAPCPDGICVTCPAGTYVYH